MTSLFKQDIINDPSSDAGDELTEAVARSAQDLIETDRREITAIRDSLDAEELALIDNEAGRIRESAGRVVVLGTGGSSLGAQTLLGLQQPGDQFPDVDFQDNLSGPGFESLLQDIDADQTHFLAISKSGSTVETMAQTLVAIQHMRFLVSDNAIRKHFTFISQPGDNPLRSLAAQFDIPVLDHNPDLPGRFSVFSVVGLLPAAIAGLDVRAINEGGRDCLLSFSRSENVGESPPTAGALFAIAAGQVTNRTISVLMPYADELRRFGGWFVQLQSESLGKAGRGATPVAALGPVDQHSQLQLFLDGPADKFFTFIKNAHHADARRIDAKLIGGESMAYLANRTLSEINDALCHGTIDSLTRTGVPCRLLTLKKLDEGGLGALLMHFMLETIIMAGALSVNAFDQPRVEEGKQLARDRLTGQMRTEE